MLSPMTRFGVNAAWLGEMMFSKWWRNLTAKIFVIIFNITLHNAMGQNALLELFL